jgi:hypothetical protein
MSTKESRGALNQVIENTFQHPFELNRFLNGASDRLSRGLKRYLSSSLYSEEFECPEWVEISEAGKKAIETLPMCFGSIWDIKPEGMSRCPWTTRTRMLIASGIPEEGESLIQVIPIHTHTEFAYGDDLVLPKWDFHPEMVIPFSLEQTIAISRLNKCVGHISCEEVEIVGNACDAHMDARMRGSIATDADVEYPDLDHLQTIFCELMLTITGPLQGEAWRIMSDEDG